MTLRDARSPAGPLRYRPAVVVFLSGASLASAMFSAKVVAVSDGDSITVLRDRTQVEIRLHGIDCPEL